MEQGALAAKIEIHLFLLQGNSEDQQGFSNLEYEREIKDFFKAGLENHISIASAC